MTALKQEIVAMGRRTGYLEARRLAKAKGGLPSNVLHDNHLSTLDQNSHMRRAYPAWTNELLVYPEADGQFKWGMDVVDSDSDTKGRKWVLPAKEVPEEARGMERVGLFVEPEHVTVEENRVVVHARSIVVLHPFIQASTGTGGVDETTRVPLEVEPELLKKLTKQERRWLQRIPGIGVRPLVRGYQSTSYRTRINANVEHDGCFGVMYVSSNEKQFQEQRPQTGTVQQRCDENGPESKDIALDGGSGLIRDVEAVLPELYNSVQSELLEPIERLVAFVKELDKERTK